MTDQARVLARVRKLLALASSPNVHEAALAAAQAQALLDRYRLDTILAEEDADPITDGREAPLERSKRPRKWRSVLASALAEANGCLAWSAERGGETELYVLGRAADRAAVTVLWEWLAPRIAWLAATHTAGRDRAFQDAFRIGAVDAVMARLRVPEPAPAEEAALVRIQTDLAARRAAVEAFAAEHLRLGKGRGLRLDAHAYARGQAAAADLPLTAPAPRLSPKPRPIGN